MFKKIKEKIRLIFKPSEFSLLAHAPEEGFTMRPDSIDFNILELNANKEPVRWNKKIGKVDSTTGAFVPRVYFSKKRKKKSPSVLIKCGCCDSSFRVFYNIGDNMFEINGVLASKDAWQTIFKEIDLI